MIGMIWAQAHQRVIGKNGQIPWHVPEDLALFQRVTRGNAVLMGRKTWDSLPPRFRPLPQRTNYVLTRNPELQLPGATVGNDFPTLLARAQKENPAQQIWIIGGEKVYAQALEFAQLLLVTDIDLAVADPSDFPDGTISRAPEIDFSWQLLAASPERGWHKSRSEGTPYRCSAYARRVNSTNQAKISAFTEKIADIFAAKCFPLRQINP